MSYSLDNIEYLEESLQEFRQTLKIYLADLEDFDHELYLDFCKLYGRVMLLKLRLQYEILKEYNPKGE